MKPEESFVGQPIRSLQTMLRTIAQVEPRQPSVIPDGIYSKQTSDAVSAFQRRKGLPVTGVTDNRTHEAIVKEFEGAVIETEPAQPIQITLNPGQVFSRGDEHHLLYLVQALLVIFSMTHGRIPMPELTGILDDDTAQSILAFQIFSDLEPTGKLDKQTWKHLSLQFSQAYDQLDNGMPPAT